MIALALLGCAPFSNPSPADTAAPAAPAWGAERRLDAPAPQDDARFGGALAGVGDVDGDGHDDLLIGAPEHGDQQGAAWLYRGPELTDVASVTPPDASAGQRFGHRLSRAGDLDGDGYQDALATALADSDAANLAGAVYLFFGGAEGLTRSEKRSSPEPASGAGYGFALAALGDWDGDGRDDFAAGDPYGDAARSGAVDLYYGDDPDPVRLRPEGLTGEENVGYSLVALSAPEGLVAGGLWTLPAAWRFPGEDPGAPALLPLETDPAATVRSPAAAADMDGDGYDELLTIGEPALFPGSPDGPTSPGVSVPLADGVVEIRQAMFLPDADGDGVLELLLANHQSISPLPDRGGRAWLHPSGGEPVELEPVGGDPTACFGDGLTAAGAWVVVADTCQERGAGAVYLFSTPTL